MVPPDPLRQRLRSSLQEALGAEVKLVSVRRDGAVGLRGLAVCSGRLLSFVLDAQQQRLRTRPLYELLQRTVTADQRP